MSSPPSRARRGLTLFVDADDTLWENNVYFEAIVAAYVALAGDHGCPPDEARARFLAVERDRVRQFGYGIANFQASLEQACDGLAAAAPVDPSRFTALCTSLRRVAGAHLDEVGTTLRALSGRHRVVLLTKGEGDDQMGKVARSGLRRYLHQVDVVPEKDVPAYRDVLRRHGADPARSWMIGNSPKSDILPALGAGLGAVFIPHAATWTLELTDLPPAGTPRYEVRERFQDLVELF
jgi:putative hydrolase of the HAD superfamily